MAFMKLQVVKGAYALVDVGGSSWPVPEHVCGKITDDMIGDACEMEESDVEAWQGCVSHLAQYIPEHGEIFSVTREQGYCWRLSAPGYLDCTEWSACDTIADLYKEALESLDGPEDPGYAGEVRALLEYARDEGMPLTDTQARYLEHEDTYPAFAWTGGYTIIYVDKDGDVLCSKCAVQTMADGGEISHDTHDEGDPEECAQCGHVMKSSYGPVDDAGDDA